MIRRPLASALPRLLLLATVLSGSLRAANRLDLNFNPDWRFTQSDPAGANQASFDDHGWTLVSAPHTYNDVDTFDHFSVPGHRGEQGQWGGRTWYRKTFTVPADYKGRKVFIEFEAARQVAEVYLNGKLLGVAKTGFTPFGFDLTDGLNYGGTNVIAVMCDNRFMKDPMGGDAPARGKLPAGNPNLAAISAKVNEVIPETIEALQADQIPWNNPHWHPAHGGLYRNVKLHVTDPLHIGLPLYSFLRSEGPYAYATDVTDETAMINVEIPAVNERSDMAMIDVHVDMYDEAGRPVNSFQQRGPVIAGDTRTFKLSGLLLHPIFWEPDYPHVYKIVCSLYLDGKEIDSTTVPVGIRSVHWDTQTGFYINGHHLKLHGWGQKPTDEWPGLGAAQPNWMHDFTLELMKEAGGNFVRWGHCAVAPTMIEAGDRLGIIADMPGVDGESDTVGGAWKLRTSAFRDTLIYFRNNPSILVWEGGNQKVTLAHVKELRGLMDKYDPHGGRAYAMRRPDNVDAAYMDIQIGTEGGREIPRLPVVEGEYDREESPRRVWDNYSPPNFGYPEAKGMTYDLNSEQYAVNQVAQWMGKLADASHSGGANWIFSDSTSGGRVAAEVDRAGGEVDGVRLPKEAYYVLSTIYRTDPQVHIIGHWTYPAGTKKAVYVASNAESVELILNGTSLGLGKRSDKFLFTFPSVTWQAGELKAIARNGTKVVATYSLHTAGKPVALKMTAITAPGGLRADGSDIALIDVEAVDADGQRCPTYEDRVDFTTTGPALWRGGYNSGKINSINNPYLDLECGINRVAVRAGRSAGAITVTAQAKGLTATQLTLTSLAFPVEGGISTQAPAEPTTKLPALRVNHSIADLDQKLKSSSAKGAVQMFGHYTVTTTYSGPTNIAHLETSAQDGRNAYVDMDSPFRGLPDDLKGADWVQAGNRDALYSAEDLVQINVAAHTDVTVAHDEKIPAPEWLKQFKPLGTSITLQGRSLSLYRRRIDSAQSLTFGSNTYDPSIKDAAMYVVFVNAAK